MRIRSKRALAGIMCGLGLGGTGCVSDDAIAALAELTAGAAGGLVEILVGDALTKPAADASEPDLDAPISEQFH